MLASIAPRRLHRSVCLTTSNPLFLYNPRSRGLSEHRVFSYEECGIPAHMPGWRHQWEEDFGKKCQRWVVTRDSTGCCEHEGCNIAVFTRTLVSILHSQWRNHHLFRRKNRMVQPDSLNVGSYSIWHNLDFLRFPRI